MDNRSLKLKKHETFSIREGWLEKGINIIEENPDCLKKNDGPMIFGLGTNMCKSLRYWLIATKLAEFNIKGSFLTDFGKTIFNYDKYLEDKFTWWMIHVNLVNNFDDAPVLNTLFNSNLLQFDKDYLFVYTKDYLSKDYVVGADSSLESDISITLKSYCLDDSSNPENNLDCPLAKLGLLEIKNKRNYYRKTPSFYSLDYRVVYYSIIKAMTTEKGVLLDFNVEDLYDVKCNPLKIFNISKSTLFVYLDEMKKNGLINFVKTAGLNTIHINEVKTIKYLNHILEDTRVCIIIM